MEDCPFVPFNNLTVGGWGRRPSAVALETHTHTRQHTGKSHRRARGGQKQSRNLALDREAACWSSRFAKRIACSRRNTRSQLATTTQLRVPRLGTTCTRTPRARRTRTASPNPPPSPTSRVDSRIGFQALGGRCGGLVRRKILLCSCPALGQFVTCGEGVSVPGTKYEYRYKTGPRLAPYC